MNEEFPGLAAAGMRSIGRFGVGFFSVFMLGKFVRVITRPYDRGDDQARVLEFRSGLRSRPILYPASPDELPIDGGTRVEILLNPSSPFEKLAATRHNKRSEEGLRAVVAALAPAIDVSIYVNGK